LEVLNILAFECVKSVWKILNEVLFNEIWILLKIFFRLIDSWPPVLKLPFLWPLRSIWIREDLFGLLESGLSIWGLDAAREHEEVVAVCSWTNILSALHQLIQFEWYAHFGLNWKFTQFLFLPSLRINSVVVIWWLQN
jgi:hypothetical protein